MVVVGVGSQPIARRGRRSRRGCHFGLPHPLQFLQIRWRQLRGGPVGGWPGPSTWNFHRNKSTDHRPHRPPSARPVETQLARFADDAGCHFELCRWAIL